jgi:uncharacterized membrane protein AbrB (regulator of aidB expression)
MSRNVSQCQSARLMITVGLISMVAKSMCDSNNEPDAPCILVWRDDATQHQRACTCALPLLAILINDHIITTAATASGGPRAGFGP